MGRYAWLTLLVVVLVLGGVVALFVIQNGARTTQLSLDLGVAAWQLDKPVSVPALMAATASGGFLLGAVPLWLRGMSRGRRLKQLERQQAVATDRTERPW